MLISWNHVQHRLMQGIRDAILEDRFPQYLKDFFRRFFKQGELYP